MGRARGSQSATPRLFMLIAPMTFGLDRMVYVAMTVAPNRDDCWENALLWAIGSRERAAAIREAFRQASGAPAVINHHLDTWACYDPHSTRSRQIAWLRRHGCRVAAGSFVADKQEQIHDTR